jgi:DHA1 family bicyclomycin/chloramphenicol resistance-like MFS transporter
MLPPPTIYMDVFKYAKPIWLDFLPLCLWVLSVPVSWTRCYWENLAVSKWFWSFDSAICISITFFDCFYEWSLGLYQTIGMLFIFLACLGISNQYRCANSSSIYKNAGELLCINGCDSIGLGAFASFCRGSFVKDSMVLWW